MKQLSIKLAVIISSIAFFLLTFSQLYKNTNQYNNAMDSIINFESNMPYNLEIVNLGNSQPAAALEYKNINGFNMAQGSQPFYYDKKMLEQYSSHLKDGCIVLIAVSYQSFYYDGDRQDVSGKYYWILNKKMIRNYSLAKELRIKYVPVLFDIKTLSYIFRDESPKQNERIESNQYPIEKLPVVGQNRAMYFQQSYKSGDGKKLKEQMALVEEIIDFCINNGYKPILFTPPYTKYLNEWFPQDMLDKYFYSHINEINKHDIPYLDYSHDLRFTDTPNLFIDTDHLNAAGRELFSRILFEDCRNRGLI